jgi:hypothetical protein
MSSPVVSTSAARGRPFIFDVENVAEVCPQPSAAELFGEARPPQRVVPASSRDAFRGVLKDPFKDARLAGVTPASRLAVRPAPEMASSGISAVDALTGGLPRGCLTEIYGPASSGRTTLLLSALAAATRRGEFCALLDANDALDPQSAASAGIELDRLLWVRCGESSQPAERRLEQLLRAADLLVESGGFGLIALDLGDLPPQTARHIPLTTWFRFRRAVEHTPIVLLAIERQSIAGSCSSLLIKLGPQAYRASPPGSRKKDEGMNSESPPPAHAQLLTKLEINAEIVRSRLERKPAGSAEVTFASKTAWAG